MATQVNTSLPMWLAGCTYDGNGGNDLRTSGVSAYFYDQGIVNGAGGTGPTIGTLGGVIGGAGLVCYAGTGMQVLVQPGHFVVPNTAAPTAGAYVSTLTSTATLAVATADPTNPRIDLVYAGVVDNGNNTSFGQVAILTGVAAPSPSVPTLPANAIPLGQITVAAGASSVTSGMISDKRPFTAATGGIIRAPKGSVIGYLGQIAYDPASNSFYHNSNVTNATQLKVLPWSPAIATRSSAFTFGGAETTVLTTTFTSDGYTDAECFFKWPGVSSSRGSSFTFNVVFRMYIDSTQVDGFFTPNDLADSNTHSGGSWSYYTSSVIGDTPSAGTHTLKVTCQNLSGNYSTSIYGYSTNKIILRAKPVSM